MVEPRVTIYTPESSLSNPFRLVRDMLRDLIASRELAWRLTVRDLNAQYRQTYLGFLWAIIAPLTNSLVWIFLSNSGVINLKVTTLPYPVYVITGTMLWAIMMDALYTPLHVVSSSRGMLAKINFPREALLVAGIYQTTINALIKVVLMLIAILIMGIHPSWSLLLFPIAMFSLILVGTVIGLMLVPVGMLYSDVGRAVQLLMQFLMYMTPVIFAMPREGLPATVFQLNPLTPLILTARDWMTGLAPEYLGYFVVVNVIALILLFVFWVVFRLAMPILIERMGS